MDSIADLLVRLSNSLRVKKETVEICFATLGEDTGIIGAAALARHIKQQGKLK